MSGNLHEQRSRSTREALRRVALDRFAKDGFANVTVAELAEQAGVTQRTFFRHFPTKEAVLFADYELQAHRKVEAGQPVTTDVLNGIYKGLLKDYYGDAVKVDDFYQCSTPCWPRWTASRTTWKWCARPRWPGPA